PQVDGLEPRRLLATVKVAGFTSAAIQAAINTAQPSDTIEFPRGTYLITTPITVTKDNLTFQGATVPGKGNPHKGKNLSVIEQANGANLSLMFVANLINTVTVTNLIFDANRAQNTGLMNGVVTFTGCSNVTFTHSEIRNSPGAIPHSAALVVGGS